MLFALFLPLLALASQVTLFAPLNEVKGVRQVRVSFSEPVVPFGDPRAQIEPFRIECAKPGTARWADPRNWIYDFAEDLPAGISCKFHLRTEVKTVAGKSLQGSAVYEFHTGGPAVIETRPYQGAYIEEEQSFLLTLDAPAEKSSVEKNAYFQVEGLGEKIPVEIVGGDLFAEIKKAEHWRSPKGLQREALLLKAKRNFPANKRITLVWGKGISTISGVATSQDQKMNFSVREAFQAKFSCERENANAKCIPFLPLSLNFNSAVKIEDAKKISLKSADGKVWPANKFAEEAESVNYLGFSGPFPEKTNFTLDVPKNLLDDTGRPLTNAQSYPLSIQTDRYPPLAKFPAKFGVIEAKDPVLPVTLRNLEGKVAAVEFPTQSLKIQASKISEIGQWMQKVQNQDFDYKLRNTSIIGAKEGKKFEIPKPNGKEAFEVVGIPLKEKGVHIVQVESRILGEALIGPKQPMFVSSVALVTNLGVHLKIGKERSVVWVTELDSAKPVDGAKVHLVNCKGESFFEGKTDAQGLAWVNGSLPVDKTQTVCENSAFMNGIFAVAEKGDDASFVHSIWEQGIEAWRYQLPMGYGEEPPTAHTVFARSLLRAGETVNMKHFIRTKVLAGFQAAKEKPKAVLITNSAGDKWEFPLKWEGTGSAETTFQIPKEAKLGAYSVYLLKEPSKKSKKPEGDEDAGMHDGDDAHYEVFSGYNSTHSGSFQVQEFRLPVMTGVLQAPKQAQVAVKEVPFDLSARYLAGGGASGLKVKVRGLVEPAPISDLGEFEGFSFGANSVKEGLEKRKTYWYYDENSEESEEQQGGEKKVLLPTIEMALDANGTGKASLQKVPAMETPLSIQAEMEFRDPNGEIQTLASRVKVWPSARIVGLKSEGWISSKDDIRFTAAVAQPDGKPEAGAAVKVDFYERKYFSHRKRLVGGFYSYENFSEVKKVGPACEGITDNHGILNCKAVAPKGGNFLLFASVEDAQKRKSYAEQNVWVPGDEESWYEPTNSDRIDLIPERKRYEPGEKAKFQVRMPFKKATVLVTTEREGVATAFVKEITNKDSTIEVAVTGNYAPNMFVSAFVVRGRVGDVKPTALIDLGKPAYKLGIAEIQVGWKTHELKVQVTSDREAYRSREKAKIKITVKNADGSYLEPDAGVSIAAVDQALLELSPNNSWKLLEAMMGRRNYQVQTSTAHMQIVGKRHFGLKAVAPGGGGGKNVTRELFDTLLLWKGKVALNAQGEAEVEIPLNDAISSFKIVAIANSGLGRFGDGSTMIRTTQELMLFSGISPLVRQGDRTQVEATVRNATEQAQVVKVGALAGGTKLSEQTVQLGANESKRVVWDFTIPSSGEKIDYLITANGTGLAKDSLKVSQKVVPAVPVRTYQATIEQIDGNWKVPVERPIEALPDRGGIAAQWSASLVKNLSSVRDFMRVYPYTCLEQRTSRAVALRDEQMWEGIAHDLPNYIDGRGFAKYFPSAICGSETLTSYLLSIANEAGYEIPDDAKARMIEALDGYVKGTRSVCGYFYPAADMSVRKVAALEALSRFGAVTPEHFQLLTIEPNLWPTSALVDWWSLLAHVPNAPKREERLKEVQTILRSRLNFQGTTMGFSTEAGDHLWWLMRSVDENAVRLLSLAVPESSWKSDIPRLVRGALARQRHGAWDLTVANAWGVLALEKFSQAFESVAVQGKSSVKLGSNSQERVWASAEGKTPLLPWPKGKEDLVAKHEGAGKPWLLIQSKAAIPLKAPLSSGYKIQKTLTPVEQKVKGKFSVGDVLRYRLEVDAQAERTWVVVQDPIPAGSTILGNGLGRDSAIQTAGENRAGSWPAFEEKGFEAYRAYYEFMPKGKTVVEYTIRINSPGTFQLPAARVEAMYSPEMFGEIPNDALEILP